MYKSVIITILIINLTLTNADVVDESIARQKRAVGPSIISPKRLIDEPVCGLLRSFCSSTLLEIDDFYTLECVQSLKGDQKEQLTSECQTIIWSHIHELVEDKNVYKLLQKSCSKDMEKLAPCKPTEESGHLLGCLLSKKEDIHGPECKAFVQRLELVAFSDFKLIAPFAQSCREDVERTKCGRVGGDGNQWSQGETIACLQMHLQAEPGDQGLSVDCKQSILRLSEMQAENFKLDWKLYKACLQDATTFCPEVKPGNGDVYKCLSTHRNDDKMSPHCTQELTRRDKLMAQDYKISRGLARSCKDDIRINKCRRGVSEDKNVRLAQILLCLESAYKNNSKLTPECLAEMHDHRKLLMVDYHLTPELLDGCAPDIETFCKDLTGAKTIHCLMEHARPKKKTEIRVTAKCQRAIEFLVKVADVGEDWRVDPILRMSCKAVVDVACRDTQGGDARVMSCLMEKLGTNYMTEDCETALLQIQYFVARDFKLDPQLYRACKDDAIKFCKAKKTWDNDVQDMDPERGPLILPCLHRYAYQGDKAMQLKPHCFQEVKRVMRQRAISVDLIPEVEDDCLSDLALFCFDKTHKGEEMQCLQDSLDRLSDRCKDAVNRYTEDEAAHVELNPIIMSVCKVAMEKHCEHILTTGKDEGDMMECLISHKNDPDLRADLKCRAAIEHFQIISLKNYHFTYKFKEACRPHVNRYCPNSMTKYDVVACLSEVMRNDTISGSRHTIPKECRQQVRAQLYQQRENINFDPKLKTYCAKEMQDLCQNVVPGAGQVLECLQTHHQKLGPLCRHALFPIKKSEMQDSSTDYTLMTTCKEMLNQFCHDLDAGKAFECLKQHRDEPNFDNDCHIVVVNRMIEQNMDFRFNPTLHKACKANIANYCAPIIANSKKDEELNGKVVDCLKNKFREGKLNTECEKQMTEVLHEQALNYKLNPLLQSVCKNEIEQICIPKDDKIEDNGEIEECLKNMFMQGKIITGECKVEVATLIQEAKADIHVDPILQRACTVDLLKYCSNVKSGNGRSKIRNFPVKLFHT